MSTKFRSQSEGPQARRKKYTGPQSPTALRNGVPTRITTTSGVCEFCNGPLKAGEGWLITLPRGNGRKGSFAAICRTDCRPVGLA